MSDSRVEGWTWRASCGVLNLVLVGLLVWVSARAFEGLWAVLAFGLGGLLVAAAMAAQVRADRDERG